MAFYRKNIGGAQQAIRVAIGACAVAVAAVYLTGLWAWVVGLSGAVFACTGFVGFCPMCAVLRIGTSRASLR